jgi:phosphatidylinositol glycan class B
MPVADSNAALSNSGRFTATQIFLLCWAGRLLIATITRTGFVPDEYFQTIEPAFRAVHGYGIATWEWLPQYRIRSYVSVLPYAAALLLLKVLGTGEDGTGTVLACRSVQATVSAIGDVAFWKILHLTCGHRGSGDKSESLIHTAMLMYASSWSMGYCMSRTLSNSTETALCLVVGWLLLERHTYRHDKQCAGPNAGAPPSHRRALAGAVLASVLCVFVRPTSLLLLVPMWLHSLRTERLSEFVSVIAPAGIVFGGLCAALDSYFYCSMESVTITPYNFFRINFIENYAVKYGENVWHWYFSQGLPVMMGGYAPLLLGALLHALLDTDTGGRVMPRPVRSGMPPASCFALLLVYRSCLRVLIVVLLLFMF